MPRVWTQPVAYEIDGEAYEGVLVYDGSSKTTSDPDC